MSVVGTAGCSGCRRSCACLKRTDRALVLSAGDGPPTASACGRAAAETSSLALLPAPPAPWHRFAYCCSPCPPAPWHRFLPALQLRGTGSPPCPPAPWHRFASLPSSSVAQVRLLLQCLLNAVGHPRDQLPPASVQLVERALVTLVEEAKDSKLHTRASPPLQALSQDSLCFLCDFLSVQDHVKLATASSVLLEKCVKPCTWRTVHFDCPCDVGPVDFARRHQLGPLPGVGPNTAAVLAARQTGRKFSLPVLPVRRFRPLVPVSTGQQVLPDMLPRLQSLDLTHFHSAVASCAALQRLQLNDTAVVDVTALSSCTALQVLNLNSTGVVDVTALSSCTALHTLNLNNTRVVDVTALSCCAALQTLELFNSRVEDVTALSCCTALQTLGLSLTGVVDVTALSSFIALQTLDLTRTAVVDVTAISTLPLLSIER